MISGVVRRQANPFVNPPDRPDHEVVEIAIEVCRCIAVFRITFDAKNAPFIRSFANNAMSSRGPKRVFKKLEVAQGVTGDDQQRNDGANSARTECPPTTTADQPQPKPEAKDPGKQKYRRFRQQSQAECNSAKKSILEVVGSGSRREWTCEAQKTGSRGKRN